VISTGVDSDLPRYSCSARYGGMKMLRRAYAWDSRCLVDEVRCEHEILVQNFCFGIVLNHEVSLKS